MKRKTPAQVSRPEGGHCGYHEGWAGHTAQIHTRRGADERTARICLPCLRSLDDCGMASPRLRALRPLLEARDADRRAP